MISKLTSCLFGLLLAAAILTAQPAEPGKPSVKTTTVYVVHILSERSYSELGLDLSPEGYAAEYVSALSTKPVPLAIRFSEPSEPLTVPQGEPLVLREKKVGDAAGGTITVNLAGSAPTYVVLLYGRDLASSRQIVYDIDLAEGQNVTRFYNPTGESVALKVGSQTALLEGRSSRDFPGLGKKFELQIAAQSIGKWRLRYSSTLHRDAEGPTAYLLMSGGGKSWIVTPLLLPRPSDVPEAQSVALR